MSRIEQQFGYDAWLYDQLQPEERLYVGRKVPRPVPGYAVPFPSHLIKNAPEELTDRQREEREDLYLLSKGIK